MEKRELGAAINTTEHYGLVKPGPDDFYDVEIGNRNLDQVDAVLKGLDDQKLDQEGMEDVLTGVYSEIKNVQKIAEYAKAAADDANEAAAGGKTVAEAARAAVETEVKARIDADVGLQENVNTHMADAIKHVSAVERNTWNAKAGTASATASTSGLMAAADKVKLDGIAAQANKTVIVNNLTTAIGGSALDAAQGAALNNTMNAHSADIVKHITAPERTAWNAKAETAVATSSSSGLMAAADKTKLDGIAAQANKTVIVNNLTTTTGGSALDAVQGKVIGDRLGGLDTKVGAVETAAASALLPYSAARTYPKSALVMSGGMIYCSAKDANKGNPVTDRPSWLQYGEIIDEWVPLPYEGKGYLMLYDNGDECVEVTGGWEYHGREGDGRGSGSKNIDNLLVLQMSSAYDAGGFTTNRKINISEYGAFAVLCEQTNGYGSWNGWRGFGLASANNWGASAQSYPLSKLVSNDVSKQSASKIMPKEIMCIDMLHYKDACYAFVGCNVAAVKFYAAFLLKSDNYQTWLIKAGLNPSSYPTLDSVVNNAAAMATLANSSAAVDYMIRCTGTIMGAVTNSTVAMTAIGKSEYAMDKIIGSSDWTKFVLMNPNAIAGLDASNPITIPMMTSNTTPSGVAKADACDSALNDAFRAFDGDDSRNSSWWVDTKTGYHWVEYMFNAPVWVYKCKILNAAVHGGPSGYLTKCKICGSNDGINYVDLTGIIQVASPQSASDISTTIFSQNNKMVKYKYIRLQAIETFVKDLAGNEAHMYDLQIPTLQFYGK